MNILSKLPIYAGKWSVKNRRKFNQEEIDSVEQATIIDSQYGMSVCFFMKGGGQTYIPLDNNSNKGVGEIVDLTQAELLTLGRAGDDDIYRVSC